MVQGWISNIVKSSATTYYSGILDHSFNRLLTSSKTFTPRHHQEIDLS